MKTPVSTFDFVVKPVATAASTFAIDQFTLNISNYNASSIFEVASGAGAYLGIMIGSFISDLSNFYQCFEEMIKGY